MPASFILDEDPDYIEKRPFVSGRFTYVYRATYKEQPVVAKVLKTTFAYDLENVHKVSGLTTCTITKPAHVTFSAFYERGCRMEMASTREHRTVRRSFLDTVTLLDSLGTDGRRKCHEFY